MFEYISKHKRTIQIIVIGLIISPLFGVIGANLVGYHEPLDVAAEALHLHEANFNWTPLKDYTIPGLPDTIGYIVAGVIGVSVILTVGYLLYKSSEK